MTAANISTNTSAPSTTKENKTVNSATEQADNVLDNARRLLANFDRKFDGFNSHAAIKSTSNSDNFINWVNSNHDKLGWRADICKLTKSNENYDPICDDPLSKHNHGSDEMLSKLHPKHYSLA